MIPIHATAVSKRIDALFLVSEYRDGYGWVLLFKLVQIFQSHRILYFLHIQNIFLFPQLCMDHSFWITLCWIHCSKNAPQKTCVIIILHFEPPYQPTLGAGVYSFFLLEGYISQCAILIG